MEHAAENITTTHDADLAERIEAYEAKIEAKRERYAERAAKHAAASVDSMKAYQRIADMIPMGQPILVGHHSERRHRRDIGRMDSNIRAAINHDKTAAHYSDKAENYGTHGISSDDPAAVLKLKEKLAGMEQDRDHMKRINAYFRKHKTLDGCPDLAPHQIERMKHDMEKDWRTASKPFETYQFSNLSANMRRVKDRIKALTAAAAAVDVEQEKDGYTYREDTAENRAMFIFPDKPDADTRAVLKGWGFKWSPMRGAWVRLLNNAAKYAAKSVMRKLDATPAE